MAADEKPERIDITLGPCDVVNFATLAERIGKADAALHRILGFVDAELAELDPEGQAAVRDGLVKTYGPKPACASAGEGGTSQTRKEDRCHFGNAEKSTGRTS
jgi:hypothetical protein